MKRIWPFAWRAALLGLVITLASFGFKQQTAQAQPKGSATSDTVIIDTGDALEGFDVPISTTPVLLGASGSTAKKVWRVRTFQVTGTPYTVWMSTFSGAYGTGAGWYVLGSTGSWTTRGQAAVYGVLDPAAGAGTGTIKGPYEYQAGEAPKR